MPLIALDVGTSFIKGAIVEPELQRVKHIHRVPFPEPLPNLPPLFIPLFVLHCGGQQTATTPHRAKPAFPKRILLQAVPRQLDSACYQG